MTTLRRATRRPAGALIAAISALMLMAVPAAVAQVSPGALDRSFGDGGVVEHWQETGTGPWSGPRGVWPGGGDRVVVMAYGMQRLTATGAEDPSFGNPLVAPYAHFSDGRWLVAALDDESGSGSPVQPMDANGHLSTTAAAFVRSVADDSGGMFVALADGTALYLRSNEMGQVKVKKVKLDGTVLHRTTFSVPGALPAFGIASGAGAIVATSTGVLRLRNDGSLDVRWGLRGIRHTPVSAAKMVPWDKGGVAVLSANEDAKRYELTLISHTGRVARHTTVASGVTFYGYEGGPFASFDDALAVDPRGRLLLARSYAVHSATTVSRYVGGRVDRTFGRNGLVHLKASHSVDAEGITVMPDGRIVVLGELERWGTIYGHNNALIPGFESHGTVLWRLRG